MSEQNTAPVDAILVLAEKLFDLAREGRTAELAAYLEAGVPVDLTTAKGDTLLVLAAYQGRADTVAMLLSRGAAHDRVDDRGHTALAAAVFRQSAAAVQHLLDAGADPDAGTPSARAAAEFFELPAMTDALEQHRR